jgi:hypothetical protein
MNYLSKTILIILHLIYNSSICYSILLSDNFLLSNSTILKQNNDLSRLSTVEEKYLVDKNIYNKEIDSNIDRYFDYKRITIIKFIPIEHPKVFNEIEIYIDFTILPNGSVVDLKEVGNNNPDYLRICMDNLSRWEYIGIDGNHKMLARVGFLFSEHYSVRHKVYSPKDIPFVFRSDPPTSPALNISEYINENGVWLQDKQLNNTDSTVQIRWFISLEKGTYNFQVCTSHPTDIYINSKLIKSIVYSDSILNFKYEFEKGEYIIKAIIKVNEQPLVLDSTQKDNPRNISIRDFLLDQVTTYSEIKRNISFQKSSTNNYKYIAIDLIERGQVAFNCRNYTQLSTYPHKQDANLTSSDNVNTDLIPSENSTSLDNSLLDTSESATEDNSLLNLENELLTFLGNSIWYVAKCNSGNPILDEGFMKLSFAFLKNTFFIYTKNSKGYTRERRVSWFENIEKLDNGYYKFNNLMPLSPKEIQFNRRLGDKHEHEVIDKNTIETYMHGVYLTLKRLK